MYRTFQSCQITLFREFAFFFFDLIDISANFLIINAQQRDYLLLYFSIYILSILSTLQNSIPFNLSKISHFLHITWSIFPYIYEFRFNYLFNRLPIDLYSTIWKLIVFRIVPQHLLMKRSHNSFFKFQKRNLINQNWIVIFCIEMSEYIFVSVHNNKESWQINYFGTSALIINAMKHLWHCL